MNLDTRTQVRLRDFVPIFLLVRLHIGVFLGNLQFSLNSTSARVLLVGRECRGVSNGDR